MSTVLGPIGLRGYGELDRPPSCVRMGCPGPGSWFASVGVEVKLFLAEEASVQYEQEAQWCGGCGYRCLQWIGRATGLAFADRGARVILAARRADALEELARQCQAAGGQALAVSTDMTDEAVVTELARRAVERFGRIDIWVNNAGGSGLLGLLEATSTRGLQGGAGDQLLRLRPRGPAALPHFQEQGHGVLINNAWSTPTSPHPG